MDAVEIKEENTTEIKETFTTESCKQSSNGSECDAGDSYSDAEYQNEQSRNEDGQQNSCTESDADSVIQEREEGDGQESVPLKKVDDDEDKKNPQYIPKRGTFYEHDDRTADDSEAVIELEKNEKDGKKKVWQDRKERWSHDRYNDNEQAPKSRTELIAIYGYDIRNEDGPPRARRRRRYGRGPNKYTRNWEDEDAYSKPPPSVRKVVSKKGKGRNDEFPPLTDQNDAQNKEDEGLNDANADESSNSGNERNASFSETNDSANNNKSKQENAKTSSVDKNGKRVGTGRIVKPKKDVQDLGYRGFTKVRQYKNSKVEQKIMPKKRLEQEDVIQTQNYTSKSVSATQSTIKDVEKEMNKLNIQDASSKNNKHINQRQTSVPPRLQGEQKGSKRYSSLRQRSLPETATPTFNTHQNYFSNDFTAANQSNQQGIMQTNPIHPATTQVPQIPPPPLPPIAQVPVTATPLLQAPPPQYPPPYPQPPPPFLQPGVAPPAFIAPQTPQLINYVQGQPQFQQGHFQSFPQQFNPVNQPTELYQPQGGITYYSTQDQQPVRSVPQKRPKAAIPIVPPPPLEPRGRGRMGNMANSMPSPNSTDMNQDLSRLPEDEQNFEDAAVTVQQ